MDLAEVSRKLARATRALSFGPPITHVYAPLDYARAPHEEYLARFGTGPREVLLVGMNPGPFGMAQTGVPFGDVTFVREWIRIDAKVKKPLGEHPKRPVQGFDCTRSEVSGARVWGWARDRFGTPDRFFQRFFVTNYCPLVFMEASGRNFTPDKLPAKERDALFRVCDDALSAVAKIVGPRFVVGIGKFAEARAREALRASEGIVFGSILHPSPASPLANRGWAKQAERDLARIGIEL